jgi:hypothetical protein
LFSIKELHYLLFTPTIYMKIKIIASKNNKLLILKIKSLKKNKKGSYPYAEVAPFST